VFLPAHMSEPRNAERLNENCFVQKLDAYTTNVCTVFTEIRRADA